LGLPDRRLERFCEHLRESVELMRGRADAHALGDAHAGAILGSMDQVQRGVDDVLASDVPATIVLQDFRHGNTAWDAGAGGSPGPVFFDWSDAVVSSPFFSPTRFMVFVRGDDPTG
jgi:hypothetical protein